MLPFAIFCGALGAVLASFAGVIAERLHTRESWIRSRSRCNACDRALDTLDLVPVLSWLSFGGRCRTCRARVPSRYAVAELLAAAIFFGAALKLGPGLPLALLCAALFLLAVVVLYDLRHMIVPLSLSVPLVAVALLFARASGGADALPVTLMLAGGTGLAFFLLHALSKGRWMGLGDAPVVCALSLLAGPFAVSGLLFSFWIGGVIGIAILVATPRGHRMGIEVPFVPFLAAGYLLAFFLEWNLFLW